MRPSWFANWSGEVCALVASGASVNSEEVASLQGRCRVAVVNNNHEIAPWADLLYAADERWWRAYPAARAFAGLKVTPSADAVRNHKGLLLVNLIGDIDTDEDRISLDRDGAIARGGNSAFQLINLVAQFGCRRQLWVGFDFCGEHWHANHPEPLKNPRAHTLEKWRKRLDANAPVLAALGVEVINASAVSALTAYPKMSVAAALTRWGVADDCGKGLGLDRVGAVNAADRDSQAYDQAVA